MKLYSLWFILLICLFSFHICGCAKKKIIPPKKEVPVQAAPRFFVKEVPVQAAPRFFVPEKNLADFRRQYGAQAVRRLNSLLAMMEAQIGLPEIQVVTNVNKFFNQVEFCSDIKTWHKSDYWASRLEFLGKGQGDCEDYAVAKFLTMVQLDVPENRFFMTYVKARAFAEKNHMVVTYYKKPGTVPYVLDNFNPKIELATERKDLVPVYSFTAKELYIQKQYGLGKQINRELLTTQKKLSAIDFEIQGR